MERIEITRVSYNDNHSYTTKKVKDEYFVDNTKIDGYQKSKIAKLETNDCFVRSVMSAFDVSYDEAHDFVRRNFYRENRKGTFVVNNINRVVACGVTLNGKKFKFVGKHPKKTNYPSTKILYNPKYGNTKRGFTVAPFLENFSSGTYIILVKQHAMAVKDGVLYANVNENIEGLQRPVELVIEIVNK